MVSPPRSGSTGLEPVKGRLGMRVVATGVGDGVVVLVGVGVGVGVGPGVGLGVGLGDVGAGVNDARLSGGVAGP
jgi:hypothetical protein